jgi:transketolase
MANLVNVHNKNLVRWAKDHPEAVVFSGDLTGSTEISGFRDAYPDRFFSMGMAEQNMLSWAGGMAREGHVPLLHTFAVFMYRRALDQLSMSICYPNLKVRLFGFLPGVTTPGGATHQAIDDIGVLSTIPNLTILEMGDATDVQTLLEPLHEIDGPVYIRMLRGELPRLFPETEAFVFDKARVLSRGNDITVITSGIATGEALKASAALKKRGLSIEHLHVSTLKPFGDPQIAEAVQKPKYGVITLENHSICNGLGSAVANVIAASGGKPLVKLGLNDTYAHGASLPYLLRHYGLDARALVEAVERMIGQELNIGDDELAGVANTAAERIGADQLEAL